MLITPTQSDNPSMILFPLFCRVPDSGTTTIFIVFDMIRQGIEHWSLVLKANTNHCAISDPQNFSFIIRGDRVYKKAQENREVLQYVLFISISHCTKKSLFRKLIFTLAIYYSTYLHSFTFFAG